MTQFVLFESEYSIKPCEETRLCKVCNNHKDINSFYVTTHKKDGSRTYGHVCNSCKKDRSDVVKHLKQKYLEPSLKICQCCQQKVDTLVLDHCHISLEFRGWLCHNCNKGIGMLGDNIEGLSKALKYLEESNARK